MKQTGKTVVVKIGSSTLVDESGRVDRLYLDELAAQISSIVANGWRPIIVTSAAIACGMEALNMTTRPTDMPSLQASAAVGQSALSTAYAESFAPFGIVTGGVLLTRHDTASRHAYLHARDTLNRMVELGVIPIVNENDTVSVEQIRFGDNDTLAALVACLVKADECIIFSDIDGLYDRNPKEPDATLIPLVENITPQIMAAAGGSGSAVGSGGMNTKVKAARVLMVAGIPLVICHGRSPQVLTRLCDGESVGTRFLCRKKPHEITPYKLWIALGDAAKGSLTVDDGAVIALKQKGSSLLSVGISAVNGVFDEGDIVDIIDGAGHVFARGKVNAGCDIIDLARGKTQAQIASNTLLRDLGSKPIVHRDELVVFE